MDLGKPMILCGMGSQTSVRRIVHAALDTNLAPAPEREVSRLMSLALHPGRRAGRGSRYRDHRVLRPVEALLLTSFASARWGSHHVT